MTRDIVDAFRTARRIVAEADEVLGFALSRLMWDGPESELTATSNAQPAILVHSIAIFRLLRERLGEVAVAAGHSLGEFSAYAAAGALDFADAVRTVRRRGELMQEAGRVRPGTMAAVLQLEDAVVERVCREAASEGGECVAANYNSPGQLVISGDVATVERAVELAKSAGARRAVRLGVSGAFHSPLMQPAAAGLAAQLDDVAFRAPAFPVVSNVTAQPVREAAEAKRLLLEQLTSPVRWTGSLQALLAAGADELVEVGPGNVLAGLVRRVDRHARARSVGTRSEVEAYLGDG